MTSPLRVGAWAQPFGSGGVDFVREAERLGIDSVWVPEFWGGDALTSGGRFITTLRVGLAAGDLDAQLADLGRLLDLVADVNRRSGRAGRGGAIG